MNRIEVLLKHGRFPAVKKLLKSWGKGSIELGREELQTALSSKEPGIIYSLVENALERDRALLQELLGTELLSEPAEFEFPVIGRQDGLIKGIAFKSSKSVKNKEDARLEPVEAFLKSQVCVFFEKTGFVGSSFQASLAFALYSGRVPDRLLLTGEIDPSGNFQTQESARKRKLALEKRRFLIWEGNIRELARFFKEKKRRLPLLIATGTREENLGAFEILKECSGSQTVRGVDWKRLVISLPQALPPGNWTPFVEEIRQKLEELALLPLNPSFHLGLKIPSALALGVGAILGTGKLPVALYHYENRRYHRVIDLTRSSRAIKKRIREPEYLSVYPERRGKKRAVVAIQIASHETREKGRALSGKLEADFFYIEAGEKGALPLSQNWERISAEAYELLNRIYNVSDYREINLIMSVPVPIAFSLGMALGNYWPVRIWHYFPCHGRYIDVLELNRLEKIGTV